MEGHNDNCYNVIHVIVSVLILYLFSTTSSMNGTV